MAQPVTHQQQRGAPFGHARSPSISADHLSDARQTHSTHFQTGEVQGRPIAGCADAADDGGAQARLGIDVEMVGLALDGAQAIAGAVGAADAVAQAFQDVRHAGTAVERQDVDLAAVIVRVTGVASSRVATRYRRSTARPGNSAMDRPASTCCRVIM